MADPVAPSGKGPVPSATNVGIGVQFTPEPQSLRVKVVNASGGAQAVGIVVGDRVIAVDGVAVSKLGPDGTVAKILGTPGTNVAITLFRNNAPLTLNVQRIAPKKKLSLDFGDMSEVLERKISP
jgi:C-terminal processing protease CtpA/Prc